jgi:hypothetical protein
VLHGFYDSFVGFAPLLTLASAVVSVGILSVYVASADRIERDIAPLAESDEDVPSAASGAVPA